MTATTETQSEDLRARMVELVGEMGQVTTIDIHLDVTEQARRALQATGYGRVQVITGDGALGAPAHAPFDRIIVPVGPWDLPFAWRDQLDPARLIVLPIPAPTRDIPTPPSGQLKPPLAKTSGF